MIVSFSDATAERIFHRQRDSRFPAAIQRRILRKLLILDAAEALDDLRVPPGNRLEKLLGDRKGQYSVRVNDQWRICFRWFDNNVHGVEVVDYH